MLAILDRVTVERMVESLSVSIARFFEEHLIQTTLVVRSLSNIE
jgi:hypothetical protein